MPIIVIALLLFFRKFTRINLGIIWKQLPWLLFCRFWHHMECGNNLTGRKTGHISYPLLLPWIAEKATIIPSALSILESLGASHTEVEKEEMKFSFPDIRSRALNESGSSQPWINFCRSNTGLLFYLFWWILIPTSTTDRMMRISFISLAMLFSNFVLLFSLKTQ